MKIYQQRVRKKNKMQRLAFVMKKIMLIDLWNELQCNYDKSLQNKQNFLYVCESFNIYGQ